MNWFEELIHTRLLNDEELLKEAFVDLSVPIMGEKAAYTLLGGDKRQVQTALGEILAWYHAAPVVLSDDDMDMAEKMDRMLRPSGIFKRTVRLNAAWYKDCIGPLLGEKDGKTIAIIPRGFAGYQYRDPDSGAMVRVNRRNAEQISRDAFAFYLPLPQRSLKARDLLEYMLRSLSKADICYFLLTMVVSTAMGFLTPIMTNLIFTSVIPSGENRLLLSVMGMMIGFLVSSFFIMICKNLLLERISAKIRISCGAAFMERILVLPAAFFKQYSAGETAERLNMVEQFCNLLINSILTLGLNILFSFFYLFQIVSFTPALLFPALCPLILTLAVSFLIMRQQTRRISRELDKRAQLNALSYELFSGIQKIKLVGAEIRAFAQWTRKYRPIVEYFNPPFIIQGAGLITSSIMLLGTVFLYFSAARSGVSLPHFIAFTVAYGMISGAILALADMSTTIAGLKPLLEKIAPLLETIPEAASEKQAISRLSGNIELNNVSFRYNKAMPLVLDNLSLKIRKGQYVAIVGKTGCGKSTLLRLLLGFEAPQLGSIYYDSHDLEKLDLRSVRRNIGVVIQNGKLFQGSLYENIVVSAPHLGIDAAWEAAELAGLADDIRAMPMGMFTMVAEGTGGISGGQKQRLLIARAIAAKPRILFFDEATSALDNITQKHVAEALGRLKSTRIVIAHRLSTIRQCDRIIVLEKGHIVEDGTYDDLITKGGIFAELVARQRLDPASCHAVSSS
jgi:NHLM bacteriocin system ABC transporter ATP-binding protein